MTWEWYLRFLPDKLFTSQEHHGRSILYRLWLCRFDCLHREYYRCCVNICARCSLWWVFILPFGLFSDKITSLLLKMLYTLLILELETLTSGFSQPEGNLTPSRESWDPWKHLSSWLRKTTRKRPFPRTYAHKSPGSSPIALSSSERLTRRFRNMWEIERPRIHDGQCLERQICPI